VFIAIVGSTMLFSSVVWVNRSWKAFLLDAGFFLVLFLVEAIVFSL